MTQSQKTLANICLFCGDKLASPSMCTFCGFKFCDEHMGTENHQCIKTRYSEYVRRTDPNKEPNIARGKFRVVCETCGFSTSKGSPIEYAGEELVQHQQIVGCTDKVYLEEIQGGDVSNSNASGAILDNTSPQAAKQAQQNFQLNEKTTENQTSIVDQILKLSSLKEKGMISNEEFEYIKKELIKKLE